MSAVVGGTHVYHVTTQAGSTPSPAALTTEGETAAAAAMTDVSTSLGREGQGSHGGEREREGERMMEKERRI